MEARRQAGIQGEGNIERRHEGMLVLAIHTFLSHCLYPQLHSLMDILPCTPQTPLLALDLIFLLLAFAHSLPTVDPPVELTSCPPSLTPGYSLTLLSATRWKRRYLSEPKGIKDKQGWERRKGATKFGLFQGGKKREVTFV